MLSSSPAGLALGNTRYSLKQNSSYALLHAADIGVSKWSVDFRMNYLLYSVCMQSSWFK